jgi:RNA polymerase sigma-70 factor (ECF subfamily)
LITLSGIRLVAKIVTKEFNILSQMSKINRIRIKWELMKQSSNEKLMQMYQRGDESAFRELFDRYNDRVYSFVCSRVFRRNDVDDLCQSIFLKLHQSKELYQEKYPFEAWLFIIARNKIIDYLRKNGKIVEVELMENDLPFEHVSDEVVMPNLSELNSTSQKVVKMKYIDELSFEEIAKILNKKPANIRQILSRSLKALRLSIKENKHEI